MTGFAEKVKNGQVCRLLSSLFAALMLSLFLLLIPRDGYSVIADFKYSLFLILSLSYIILMLAALAAAFALGKKPAFKKHMTPVNIALAFYLAFTVVSACLSPYGTETLLGGTRHDGLLAILIYACTFLLLSRYFRPQKWHLVLFAVSVAAFCFISLLQLEGFNPLGLYPNGFDYFGADVDYAGAYIGTVGNTNLAAPILAGAAALFFAVIIRPGDPRRVLLAVPLALALYVLIKTDVSSALLALALFLPISLPAFAGTSKKRRLAAFIATALILTAALLIFLLCDFTQGVLGEISLFLKGKGQPGFGSGRLYIWKSALDAAAENPLFGTGPDTFRFLGLEFIELSGETSLITAAHNDYLNILVNQGIFALASYLVFLGLLAAKWYTGEENTARLAAGCFAAVFAMQLFFGISMPVNAPFFWLALAILNSGGSCE